MPFLRVKSVYARYNLDIMNLVPELEKLSQETAASGSFSGVVALRRQGQFLFGEAYGWADRAWQIKNRPDTRFRLASVSKLFTAVATLQLVDRGLLTLEMPVAATLGLESTQISPAVTVEHLLTMTAGIADWFEEGEDWAAAWAALCHEHPLYLFRQNADYLPLFVNSPPLGSVGETHRYNNASYILLGLLIEKVTGTPYFDYVRQQIFAPAGMADSDFLALEEIHENVAEGYVPVINEEDEVVAWKRNIYAVTPVPAADGGATAPSADLFRFLDALRASELLNPDRTSALLSPHGEEDTTYRGYTWEYGYGFQFLRDNTGQIVRYGKTGEEDGVSCRLYHYPQQELDVVILGNQSWCAGKLGWEIHDLIVGG